MATISTTLGALVTAAPALTPIGLLKLRPNAAYHVKKLTALVASETRHFDAERVAYITELGVAKDTGFQITPDSEAWPIFVARLDELAAVPVEIAWGPITLDLLGDAPVTAADLAALGPLFADPAEDA